MCYSEGGVLKRTCCFCPAQFYFKVQQGLLQIPFTQKDLQCPETWKENEICPIPPYLHLFFGGVLLYLQKISYINAPHAMGRWGYLLCERDSFLFTENIVRETSEKKKACTDRNQSTDCSREVLLVRGRFGSVAEKNLTSWSLSSCIACTVFSTVSRCGFPRLVKYAGGKST